MTHSELFEWQFANELQDEWWMAVAGKAGTRSYTLAEVKQLKENAPRSTIQLMHTCFTESENQEWIDYELERIEPIIEPSPLPVLDPSPQKPGYDAKRDMWNATLPQMMRLTASAISACGWTVSNANDTIGMVSFETKISWGSWSGMSCSMRVVEAEPFWFSVTGTGKQNVRGMQMAAFDLGETKATVNKVRQKMIALVNDTELAKIEKLKKTTKKRDELLILILLGIPGIGLVIIMVLPDILKIIKLFH